MAVMAPSKKSTPQKSKYELWQDTINLAAADPRWQEYDKDIKRIVDEYNRYLSGSANFFPLDWRLIKAMVWTETGAHHPKWKTRPIQIGNEGDPGLQTLLSGKEGALLVIPPAIFQQLSLYKVRTNPIANIQAGAGYLLMRCAYYGQRTTIDPQDSKVYEYTIKAHDSYSKIAREQGTTLDVLRKLNPKVSENHLLLGTVVQYQKATTNTAITGWMSFTTRTFADRYNGHGDVGYQKKLDYCLSVMNRPARSGN